MKQNLTLEALRQLLERRDMCALRDALTQTHPADLAELLDELDRPEMLAVFRALPKELAAEVFSDLPPEDQQALIQAATDQELSAIVEELWVDDAVDLLEELPAGVVKRVLQAARPDTRQLINQFLHYPENSVGSIMTAEFTDLKRDMTVAQAIAHIRRTGADSESIYTCYVTDAARRLEGVVTIRELLLAGDQALVADLMERDVITAGTGEDREEAVARLMKYDFLSLPVVDREGRLVGIVTVDDGMDVLEEEATEDFEKMAAMAPSERPYLKTGVFTLARHRIVWLLVLMISGMITGGILGRYEAAFSAMPLLVTFIPMLTDTGGNAGSQSSTLVIRGMAVGEIRLRVNPDSLNLGGQVHGGLLYALADVVTGITARADGRRYVTQSAHINFIRNVSEGVVTAKGEMIRRGKTISILRSVVTDEKGTLLAEATVDMFCTGE